MLSPIPIGPLVGETQAAGRSSGLGRIVTLSFVQEPQTLAAHRSDAPQLSTSDTNQYATTVGYC